MPGNHTERRNSLRTIAEQTLKDIEDGSYTLPNDSSVTYNLKAKINMMTTGTRYYAAESFLSSWSSSPVSYTSPLPTEILLLEVSSIEGVHLLSSALHSQGIHDKIGILNFASAKRPGGGVSVLQSSGLENLSLTGHTVSQWCSSSRRVSSSIIHSLSIPHDNYCSTVLHCTQT